MIVDPDFLDHWRTGMVADAIGDPMAAIYILRLWAHCQERKSDTFVMPPAGLKAQCKCPADAAIFEAALIEAGFLARDGNTITVLGWAEKNASLIAAWENGSKGGRPKKNPDETHGKPTGNPALTQGEPSANPDGTDKSREEKNSPSLRSGEARASRLPNDWSLPEPWQEWAKAERPDLDPIKTAEQFADFWRAKPGKDGRKLDWLATWRNWVRNQRAPLAAKTPQALAPPITTHSNAAERTRAEMEARMSHLNSPEAKAAAEAARLRFLESRKATA